MTPKYWIIVASKDHVMRGVSLGIAQSGHGKRSGLAQMNKGDMITFYSPKIRFESDEPLHAFTAIGEIADEDVFQVEELPDFKPFRRTVRYIKTGEVRIRSLIPDLTFIRNKKIVGLYVQVRHSGNSRRGFFPYFRKISKCILTL